MSASFSNEKIGGCYWRPKTASKAKGQKVRPFLMKRTQDNAINMPLTIKYFSIEYYDVFGPWTGLYLAFLAFLSDGINVHYFTLKVANFGQNQIIFPTVMSRRLTIGLTEAVVQPG